VAIAGSTGFIGSELVRALEARGDDVVRIVRPGAHVHGIEWEPERRRIDAAALEGVDAVVNLAGATVGKRWTAARKRMVRDSRVLGTRTIAAAIAEMKAKPRILVNASAIGYYGDRGTQMLDETSGPGRGFMSDVSQRWEAETVVAADAGVRVVPIRTGLVLDPSGGLLKQMLPFFKMGFGGRLGDGTQYMSWIARDDEVGAIEHVLDGGVSGAVNLTAPNPVTNLEFTRALAGALGRPAFLVVPLLGLSVVYGRELTADLLVSQRVMPRTLVSDGYRFRHPDLDQAFRSMLT